MRQLLSGVREAALELLFPLSCVGCRDEGAVICARCLEGAERLAAPFCQRCANPGVEGVCRWCLADPPALDSLYAAFRFDGVMREAVHRFKYSGLRAAAAQLASLLAEAVPVEARQADFLAPVPLHRRRLRSRGYNQSLLLAGELGRLWHRPVHRRLLERVGNPAPQVETRSQEERRRNVAGCFVCREELAGASVLLVDDVATTGSTLGECAAVLKAAGAARVDGAALARQPAEQRE